MEILTSVAAATCSLIKEPIKDAVNWFSRPIRETMAIRFFEKARGIDDSDKIVFVCDTEFGRKAVERVVAKLKERYPELSYSFAPMPLVSTFNSEETKKAKVRTSMKKRAVGSGPRLLEVAVLGNEDAMHIACVCDERYRYGILPDWIQVNDKGSPPDALIRAAIVFANWEIWAPKGSSTTDAVARDLLDLMRLYCLASVFAVEVYRDKALAREILEVHLTCTRKRLSDKRDVVRKLNLDVFFPFIDHASDYLMEFIESGAIKGFSNPMGSDDYEVAMVDDVARKEFNVAKNRAREILGLPYSLDDRNKRKDSGIIFTDDGTLAIMHRKIGFGEFEEDTSPIITLGHWGQ